jgi:RNA polymerase sigma factor (sigma-70 family)
MIVTGPSDHQDPADSGALPSRTDSEILAEASASVPNEWEEVELAQHDPFAFAPLYERYVDAIFGYCLRRTSDREQAADLTSQIFVKALGALHRFSIHADRSTFRSWLFSIAHNHVVDVHRARREQSSLDDRPRSIPDPAPSPEEYALASERRQELVVAMAGLTEGQRQIVELRLAGLTGPEIAAVLGMQVAAVKSAQFRAYARLRHLLRHIDHGGSPDAAGAAGVAGPESSTPLLTVQEKTDV